MTPTDTPEADAAPAPGDVAALRRLLRFGGWTLLDSLTAMFFAQAPVKIAALREGVATGDARAVEMAAHSLKSSSAQLGAPPLHRICQQLEAGARRGSLEGAAALVERMEPALAAFAAWLDAARPTLEHA